MHALRQSLTYPRAVRSVVRLARRIHSSDPCFTGPVVALEGTGPASHLARSVLAWLDT